MYGASIYNASEAFSHDKVSMRNGGIIKEKHFQSGSSDELRPSSSLLSSDWSGVFLASRYTLRR